MPLVSRRELAEKLGISRRWVGRLIDQGKIVETDAGIDLDKAVSDYKRNVDPSRRDGQRRRHNRPDLQVVVDNTPAAPATEFDGNGQGVLSLADAKAKKEHFNAEKARLSVEVELGNLVRREEVLNKQFEAARVCRDALLGLPSRVVGRSLQEATEEVERVIRTLEDALSKI